MNFAGILLLALVLAGTSTAAAGAVTVSGNLEHPAVVWISEPNQPKVAQLEMRNRERQFIPELLIVHAGDSVRFPNDDPYYHSIYSVSAQDPFDIGYYGTGPGKVVLFSTPGVVEVRCHIHPSMHGTIIVADGPASTGAVSAFSLSGISPGKHTLHVWTDGGTERTVQITIPTGKPTIDVGRI